MTSSGDVRRYPLDHKRGWLIVSGSLLMQFVVFGLEACFPVFHHQMLHDPGLGSPTRAQLSLVNSIATSIGLWIGWLWGYVGNQFGPKVLLTLSTVLIAFCMLLPPLVAHSFATLLLLYSIPLTLAAGIANSPLATTVGSWFDKKLPLALGIAGIGGGVGTLVLPIVAGYIADQTGSWRTSYYALSSATVIAIIATLMVSPRIPVEETRPELDKSRGVFLGLLTLIRDDVKRSLKHCVSKPFIFTSIAGFALGYCFFTTLYVVIIIAQDFGTPGSPYETSTPVSLTKASSVFVYFGIAQCFGSFAWGFFATLAETRQVTALSYGFTAVALLALGQANEFYQLAIGMSVVGFTAGGGWTLLPTLLVEYDSEDSILGIVMGLGYAAIGVGGTVGPVLTTVLSTSPNIGNQSYTVGLAVTALVSLIGGLCCQFGIPPQPPEFDRSRVVSTASRRIASSGRTISSFKGNESIQSEEIEGKDVDTGASRTETSPLNPQP